MAANKQTLELELQVKSEGFKAKLLEAQRNLLQLEQKSLKAGGASDVLSKKITNSNSLINFGAIQYRKDQVMYMNGDNTKLKDKLNWTPQTSLEYGLLQTINNIKKLNEYR